VKVWSAAASLIAISAMCSGFVFYGVYGNRREGKTLSSRNAEADRVVIDQAVAINDFIGGKNEDGLRGLFAFYEMLSINIEVYRDGIMERRTGKATRPGWDYVKGTSP
jgi:hypothetical protein